jgi:enterochelin esterase-like enzyme
MDRLLHVAKTQPVSDALKAELISVMGAENIRKGTAIAGNGPNFMWAVESPGEPVLYVNDEKYSAMQRVSGNLWFHAGRLKTGNAYKFHYVVEGAVFGGALNIPAYTEDSYAQPGVPQGTLSEKMVHISKKIYPGMQTNYWMYLPAGYDPASPVALMIWQDGERLAGRNNEEVCILCPGLVRILEVTDNLLAQKRIPMMAHLFVQAGTLDGRSMRSIEYDSVTDKYPRFLIEELLPEVYAKYSIRRDGYSHAIQGQSSGGICAFNAGWHFPDQFSRIATQHGTFTAVAFRNHEPQAAHVYPTWVRREPRKNLRVWVSDGSEDYENEWGSWPTQNLQLANSLKFRGYDFRFYLGNGNHHAAIWAAKLPEALVWLWRDYDPARTSQVYEQDPAEKDKPFYRIKSLNRQ